MTCSPCRSGLSIRVLERLRYHYRVEYRCVECSATWRVWERVGDIE